MKNVILGLLILIAFLPGTSLAAAEYKILNSCDTDKSKSIDDAELLYCLLLRDKDTYETLGPIDKWYALVGSSCEAATKRAQPDQPRSTVIENITFLVANELSDECADLTDNLGPLPFKFDQLARTWALTPVGGSSYLVRRSVEEIDLFEEPKSFAKATGAIISFSKNYLDQATTLTAEGALMRVGRFDRGDWLRARIPSLSLKKVEIKKPNAESTDGEVDELTARYAFHFARGGDSSVGRNWGHEFKIGLAYLSDTDFDEGVGAIEAEWTPFRVQSCFSSFRRIGKTWDMKCSVGLRTEGGRVFESDDPEQTDNEDFLRIGPAFGLQLGRGPLTLSLRYIYRYEVDGKVDHSDLFRVGLDLALDSGKHWSLNTAYEDGELPLSLKASRTLIIGLGIKY